MQKVKFQYGHQNDVMGGSCCEFHRGSRGAGGCEPALSYTKVSGRSMHEARKGISRSENLLVLKWG